MLEKKEDDVTLDEVDQLFRLALTASWCKCGDDHAHGQADIRVDALLEKLQLWREPLLETMRREANPKLTTTTRREFCRRNR